MSAARILLAALFVGLLCRAAGFLLLRALALSLRRAERPFLEFSLGAGLVSLFIFSLAATHLFYTSVLMTTGLLLLSAAFLVHRRGTPRNQPDSAPLPRAWQVLFWCPYLLFGVLYFIAALSPEISPDAAVYHLGLVSRYYDHRGFFTLHTSMFAGLAGGVEMLFLAAFALGRHSAAALVHLWFLLLLPPGMLAWARRAGMPTAGVVGALLFYLAPVVAKDGTVAYIDVAAAAIVFAAFSFLRIWSTDNAEAALAPAGLLAGFACACKITVTPVALYALLYVVVASRFQGAPAARTFRRLGIVTAGIALMALPWMLKDFVQFGNPFFPLFNAWFPNPWQYPMVEAEIRREMSHMSGIPWAGLPWQATVGGKLAGVVGPVFLLVPLALLSLRRREGRVLLLAFLPVFLPFFTNTGARFLIPGLPFLALALALGLLSVPRAGATIAAGAVVLHAVLSWPAIIPLWSPGFQWRIEQTDWRVALRVIPEKQYLETTWRDYKPGLLLDRFVPPSDLVFSPDMGQMAYHHRQVLGTFDSALGRRAFLTFLMPLVPELGATWNREIHFPALTTTRLRLAARRPMDRDYRISELRLALDQAVIPRQSYWRFTASANPWEAALAFDGSPVSWWTSGEYVRPGTSLEVDFRAPLRFNRILVSQSEDQRWISLGPRALVDGVWLPLHARETDSIDPPRPTLRRETRDELKRLGIRWMLILDGSYGAEDLRSNATAWGITQIAEANNFRLWKLD